MLCSWASILIHTSFLRLRLFFFYLCMLALISVFYFVLLSDGQKHLHSSMLVITSVCSVQFSSVTQSCLTFCDPMDCSTPGLPVHHQLLEFTQTHVHCVGDAIQPSHPLLSPSPSSLIFPSIRVFSNESILHINSHQSVLEFQL